jgi:hypothetical protein
MVVENQAHLAGRHGSTQSFAVSEQLSGVACFVSVLKESNPGLCEFRAKTVQKDGPIGCGEDRRIEDRVDTRK